MRVAAAGVAAVAVLWPATARAVSCVSPLIGIGTIAIAASPSPVPADRGRDQRVIGRAFYAKCNGRVGGGCARDSNNIKAPSGPNINIQLTLLQGEREWLVARADADKETFEVAWQFRLPQDVVPGPAKLIASGPDVRAIPSLQLLIR